MLGAVVPRTARRRSDSGSGNYNSHRPAPPRVRPPLDRKWRRSRVASPRVASGVRVWRPLLQRGAERSVRCVADSGAEAERGGSAVAMYNGIGLPTPRGSGTNGYVQRNLSALRHKRERAEPRADEELRRADAAALPKRPNRDILDHERKRKVELKCLELSELMEEQGYTESEIQEKVATFRTMLLERDVVLGKEGDAPEQRPTVTETHQLAEAAEQKNERLRAAFGISDTYVDGSAFDPARRKEATPQKAPEAPPPPSAAVPRASSSSPSPSPKQKKKKKKKDRGRSESRSGERKKAKKKKHSRSRRPRSGSTGLRAPKPNTNPKRRSGRGPPRRRPPRSRAVTALPPPEPPPPPPRAPPAAGGAAAVTPPASSRPRSPRSRRRP
ncbi:serine/arginine repetitive matrix protein 2 [Gallus gallus]|uniref:serine/arginine repetitive matrix protein 2 n=1 Tax=Gallus gallus TaxID=9031 RepID=UPI001F02458D|nr:serine/arginine repetitive matrix protein 2 [Gallus gallus]